MTGRPHNRPEPCEATDDRSRRYVVARNGGLWRVMRGETEEGYSIVADDAIRLACELARDIARAGRVGVVVVDAEVQEMHCFTPRTPVATLDDLAQRGAP